MAEIFSLSESHEVINTGGPGVDDDPNASWKRSTNRTSLQLVGNGGQCRTYEFTPTTDLWAHCTAYELNSNNDNNRALGLRDSSNVEYAAWEWRFSSLRARIRDASGTTQIIDTGIDRSAATLHDLDIYYNHTGGEVKFYIDGVLAYTYSGTLPAVAPQISRLFFLTDFGTAISEVRVSTSATIGTRVETEAPTAEGTDSTDGTGAYTDIDEQDINDSDGISLPTAGNRRSFTSPARTVSGSLLEPKGLKIAIRAKRGATGPTQLRFYLLIGGTRYFSPNKALQESYEHVYHTFETNPATAAPWTMSEIQDAALEWGWEAVA